MIKHNASIAYNSHIYTIPFLYSFTYTLHILCSLIIMLNALAYTILYFQAFICSCILIYTSFLTSNAHVHKLDTM